MKIRFFVVLLWTIFLTGCGDANDSIEEKVIAQKNAVEQKEVAAQKSRINDPSKNNQQIHNKKFSFNLKKQKKNYQLTSFEVLGISESPYDNGPALAVSFSVPLDLNKNIQQQLSVTDTKNIPVDGAWVVNQQRTRAFFQYIEPNQTYNVLVEPQIYSINGQQLVKRYKQKIKTNPLKNMVKFANKGKVLPSKLTRGIAVESVNIKQVDINFHRVFEESIPKIISQRLDGYSYYVREIPQYSELAYTARYTLDYEKNKTRTTILPIHKIQELQQPGLYIAVMKPAGEYPYQHQVTSFYISNLGLNVTNFDNQQVNNVSVHSLTIEDGEPVKNVSLSAVNQKGKLLAKAVTDESGNFVFANLEENAVIIGRLKNDFAVISLASPALDLSEQISLTRIQQKQELFLYGPRDLYRPGETIHINGVLRDQDGEAVPSVALKAKMIRPDGRLATSFTWHPAQQGFYKKSLDISASDPTGQWTLEVVHPSKAKFQYLFSVEEFLPERMKLELTSEAQEFVSPKTDISINGQGDYLYGAPAADNRIAARITVKPNHFPLEQFKDFYFGKVTTDRDIKNVELDDQKLDKNGASNWLLPNLWRSNKFPTQVVFEASLFESGGRPVTRRIRQNIWAGGNQIGLRPLYKEKIVKAFQQAEFEIIHSNSQEKLQPIGQLEINLIREDTSYYWRERNRGWDYAKTRKETRVYSRMIDEPSERVNIQLPVDYGRYRVEIKDRHGNLKNAYQFFAGWYWDENGDSGVIGARPDKIRINFDQESYSANQIAKVSLISPHLGNALIRVESDSILWEKQIKLTSLEQSIELPISEDWKRHDLYITAMVVSPSQKDLESNVDSLPKRALGVQALRLDRNERRLNLTIKAPEVVEPEKNTRIRVLLDKAPKQHNQKVWVTLAAVDTGVLSLSGYKTPDPFDWFFGQRKYLGNIRDSFSYLIKNQQGNLGKLQFGGDAELTRGGEQPATDVQIVSIFSELVQFDSNGVADIPLELPNFNGELRLMAVAFSDNQFASQETTMKVRAPIVAEISMPRFLAKADQTTIAFDMQNLSGKNKKLTSILKFSGAISAKSEPLVINLKDKQKHTELFDITAIGIGEGKIELLLSDHQGDIHLTRQWKLNVRPVYPAEFVRHRKVLQQGEKFELKPELIEKYDPESLQSKISLSSMPPIDTTSHLQGLLQYPYGCLEQTSSRAWPLMNYQPSAKSIQLTEANRQLLKEKNKHINAAIQRINSMQKYNGSFGLWSNQSREEHWLTVYALEFLFEARKAGYSVPDSILNKGLERIKSYVKSTQPSYEERNIYSENKSHFALAFRAYASYLLSKHGNLKLSDIRLINSKLSKDAKSGLPLAHLARAFENSGDNKTAIELWDKAISFRDYSLRYSGDYGSLLRDTAWMMNLAAESQLDIDYQNLIFRINDEIISKQWFSTQERFAIYRLGLILDKMTKADWTAKLVSKDGQVSPITNQKKYSQWLTSTIFEQGSSVDFVEGSSLFVDLQLVGYPIKEPSEVSEGIKSLKRYYNLQGTSVSLDSVKSGDYVLTRLDISSNQKIPDALVVDLLPAGFELENPGLEFSQNFNEVKIDGRYVYQWHYQAKILHTEYRDDRFVTAISLNNNQSTSVFYLMRAVTPGVYQIPPVQVEDMYRPYLRSLSAPMNPVTVTKR